MRGVRAAIDHINAMARIQETSIHGGGGAFLKFVGLSPRTMYNEVAVGLAVGELFDRDSSWPLVFSSVDAKLDP
ncbi:MAG: hypothetical protein DHS20C16_24560 [Phycisphaerae bacterium]|nr:MAG: hypothetical protein DHS20C16_24560 [Phycisphaerae bacterium]